MKNFNNQEKKIWNPEKYVRIKKKIMKSRKNNMESRKKMLKSKKIFRNQEKNFRIEKIISESRKIFQNREIFCYKNREKSLKLNVFTTFLHNSFIACVRLVIVKSCFAQNVALKLEISIISVIHLGIKQGLS